MDEKPELPALLPVTTYLQEVAIEAHELFTALRGSGFTEKQATNIVAMSVSDAVDSRGDDEYYVVGYISSDEDDDFEDDADYDGDAGF